MHTSFSHPITDAVVFRPGFRSFHLNNILADPSAWSVTKRRPPNSTPRLQNPRLSNLERPRLSSEEVHGLTAVIVPNDLHPGFPELVRPNIALVPLGPQRQVRETVQVRIQMVDKGDEGAHDVDAVAAGRRRERAEEVEGDVSAVERAEDWGLREASGGSGERACDGCGQACCGKLDDGAVVPVLSLMVVQEMAALDLCRCGVCVSSCLLHVETHFRKQARILFSRVRDLPRSCSLQ